MNILQQYQQALAERKKRPDYLVTIRIYEIGETLTHESNYGVGDVIALCYPRLWEVYGHARVTKCIERENHELTRID